MKRLGLCLPAFAVVLAVAADSDAHSLGISRGDYRLDGATVRATLTFAPTELAFAVPELDRDDDLHTSVDPKVSFGLIEHGIVDRIVVHGDGVLCPGKLDDVEPAEQDGVELTAEFTCPKPPSALDIDFAVVDVLTSGHRHLAHASWQTGNTDWIALRSARTKHLLVGAGAPPESTKPSGPLPLFRMGIEHILTGYDHLLFLAGLVLAPGKLRSLLVAITAFTVAHSVTLALAALGIWGPSPRIVEPAIALSIAYVGIENCFGKHFTDRWKITFPFGLLHGFGFASALRAVSMPRAELPLALLSFNLGVEAGQLAAISVAVPLLFLARRYEVIQTRGTTALSAAVGLAGAIWFIIRVVGA